MPFMHQHLCLMSSKFSKYFIITIKLPICWKRGGRGGRRGKSGHRGNNTYGIDTARRDQGGSTCPCGSSNVRSS